MPTQAPRQLTAYIKHSDTAVWGTADTSSPCCEETVYRHFHALASGATSSCDAGTWHAHGFRTSEVTVFGMARLELHATISVYHNPQVEIHSVVTKRKNKRTRSRFNALRLKPVYQALTKESLPGTTHGYGGMPHFTFTLAKRTAVCKPNQVQTAFKLPP